MFCIVYKQYTLLRIGLKCNYLLPQKTLSRALKSFKCKVADFIATLLDKAAIIDLMS